jgi:hypothetical protein
MEAGAMKLFMSGTAEFSTGLRDTPTVVRIKKFLDKSKDGELFTSSQISASLSIPIQGIRELKRYLEPYYTVSGGHGKQSHYGKPATMKELRRLLSKEKK